MEQLAEHPARIFRHRDNPETVCVEWCDENGGRELALFGGVNAIERALWYARNLYTKRLSTRI